MRLELTQEGLLVCLANDYTTHDANALHMGATATEIFVSKLTHKRKVGKKFDLKKLISMILIG